MNNPPNDQQPPASSLDEGERFAQEDIDRERKRRDTEPYDPSR